MNWFTGLQVGSGSDNSAGGKTPVRVPLGRELTTSGVLMPDASPHSTTNEDVAGLEASRS